MAPVIAARFWGRVDRSGECWLWTAGKSGGYGVVGHNSQKAHRVAWELTIGPIPQGMQVLHRCDNPPCVNPEHLFLGTNHDNMLDRQAKGRTKNLFTSDTHPFKVLDSADIRMIRTLRRSGWKQRELAVVFGVSRGHIAQLTRPHLMEETCQ